MDQTSFALLVDFFVGTHVGALVVRNFLGWSLWFAYPTGGLIGFLLFAVVTFLVIELAGRVMSRLRPKK